MQSHSPGRPPQIRQTSFTKRHCSFDTPSEVPGVPERYLYRNSLTTNNEVSSTDSQKLLGISLKVDPSYEWPSDKWHDNTALKLNKTSHNRSYIPLYLQSVSSSQKNAPTSATDANTEIRNKHGDILALSGTDNTPDISPLNDFVNHRHNDLPMDLPRTQQNLGNCQRNILSPIPLRPPFARDLPPLKQMPHSLLPTSLKCQSHTDLSDGIRYLAGTSLTEDSNSWSELPALTAALSTSSCPKYSIPEGNQALGSPHDRLSPALVHIILIYSFLRSEMFAKTTSSIGSSKSSLSSNESCSVTSMSSMPAPNPPIILTPPPINAIKADQSSGKIAPHEPFLSHNPPANDCNIVVDTLPTIYKLVARLPGYQRESM